MGSSRATLTELCGVGDFSLSCSNSGPRPFILFSLVFSGFGGLFVGLLPCVASDVNAVVVVGVSYDLPLVLTIAHVAHDV